MAKPAKTSKSKPAPPKTGKGKAAAKPRKPARPAKGSGRTKSRPAAEKPSGAGLAKLHALLIASDFYLPNSLPEGTYPNLAGCVRDVEHVEQFLRRRLGLTDDHLVKLTSTDAGGKEPKEPPERRPTYENMVRAFQRLIETAAPGDQVYIHYSGHGGRSPTIVPRVKGPDGLDESIVPIDIGNSSARYLRDVEIARLLKGLVSKGLVVTVIFDCCHSGGLARAAVRAETDVAVRGVDFVDSTPRPTDSLVGTLDELAATWGEGREEVRGEAVTRNLLTQAEALGYTLLAACRPSELAYEAVFEGTERNGALTYWLLQALQQLGPGLTYRMVYDRVLAQVHSRFAQQTPLLQGEADRVVFGTCTLKPELAAAVMSVTADGKSVKLEAGEANLVRPGSQFAVYPNDTLDFAETTRRIAVVRVRTIDAAASTADVIETFGAARIQPGDVAVLIGAPAQKLVRKVRLERADGKPPGKTEEALQNVLKRCRAAAGWRPPRDRETMPTSSSGPVTTAPNTKSATPTPSRSPSGPRSDCGTTAPRKRW
jgi:hypothetical protein